MTTLAVILNYDLPEATDVVYEALAPHCGDAVDLRVLDNGSPPGGRSRYTTDETGENLYFGGGLNWAFARMLAHPEYEHLLFLNNDIVLHGPRFVSTLVAAARAGDHRDRLAVHPAPRSRPELLAHDAQLGHRSPRRVEWVDFTAPLVHRRVVEAIGQFDDGLLPGYCLTCCAGWSAPTGAGASRVRLRADCPRRELDPPLGPAGPPSPSSRTRKRPRPT